MHRLSVIKSGLHYHENGNSCTAVGRRVLYSNRVKQCKQGERGKDKYKGWQPSAIDGGISVTVAPRLATLAGFVGITPLHFHETLYSTTSNRNSITTSSYVFRIRNYRQ